MLLHVEFALIKDENKVWVIISYFIKPVFNLFRNFKIMFASNYVKIMPTCVVVNSCIEDHVYLHDYVSIFNSEIGAYTYIQRFSTVGNATIGRYCSIAENVKVGLGVHPVSEMVSTHPFCYGKNRHYWLDKRSVPLSNCNIIDEHPRVYIGNDVNIGAGVIVLNGVKIGDGVIIGAGSVVTKNIPDYAVVVGVPAEILKYRFCEDDIDKLHKLQWWNWDVGMLRKYMNLFSSLKSLYEENKRSQLDD